MMDFYKSTFIRRTLFAKTHTRLVAPGSKLLGALLLLLGFAVTVASISAGAQTLLNTVLTGSMPVAVDVNSVTNKIYVANANSNNVTVIDGATNSTATVPAGWDPQAVVVNAITNKIYVANADGNTVTVIDGTNNHTVTVGVGYEPMAIAANPVTNKIYVSNYRGNSVTVIDGATNSTSTVAVGSYPEPLAVDQITNKIYVVNCGSGNITIIDGATNSTSTVSVGGYPEALAINQQTNMVYVANYSSNNLTIINGTTRSTSTVSVGLGPSALAVNAVTNQVYVANERGGSLTIVDGATQSVVDTVPIGSNPNAVVVDPVTNKAYVINYLWYGTLTMIDGATDVTSTLPIGAYPAALAANWTSDRIYVANSNENTVSVIAGASSGALLFVPMTPCRVVDTRLANGPFGGPTIQIGTSRSFPFPTSTCLHGMPAAAAAYSLNVTIVPHGVLGYLAVWPTGEDRSAISVTNSADGRFKANAAIVPAGFGGAISAFASNGTTDVVLDINGYFVPAASDPSALAFYPLKPCRIADTRGLTGPLGGPNLQLGKTRQFPILSAVACNIPTSARAYSLNFTAVPRGGPLYTFSAWPAGQTQPTSSTLNAPTGTVTANAAIIPAGTSGEIAVEGTNDTDMVIDTNGYFAPVGSGGLSLYPSAPCRALDTRKTIGIFSGQLVANIEGSPCGVPSAAQAFVLNATVVPNGPLWVLTLWPDGQLKPSTSTLNAYDGVVTSNMAIVPTTNGLVDAFANGSAALVLDISSYFAP
ncbi:MAG: YncE family protein [Candidatus Korobacteraceae bacterium]